MTALHCAMLLTGNGQFNLTVAGSQERHFVLSIHLPNAQLSKLFKNAMI